MNSLLVILLATSVVGAASDTVGFTQLREAQNVTQSTNTTNSSINVIKVMKDALEKELNTSTHPQLVGAVALIFGACMWIHGARFLDVFVTIALAVVVGILAKQSVLSYWQQHDNQIAYFHAEHSRHMAAQIVGIEAGLVTAAAVFKAHKGVMIGVGAAAGFWFASVVSNLMVQHASHKFDMAEVQVVWYSLVVFPAAYAVYTDKHERFLAYVAPFVGGLFISSAVMYFTTNAIAAKCARGPCSPPHPQTGQWVKFFDMAFHNLVSQPPRDVDYGPFHGAGHDIHVGNSTTSTGGEGGVIFLDHVILLVMWLFLWLVGVKIQTKCTTTTKGREHEDLSEALLTRL